MKFLPELLENYIDDHCSPQGELLTRLDRETNLKMMLPQMLSGNQMGQFLELICHITNPKLVVEIGTFTGYSAICMAKGMSPGSKLHTIEIDEEQREIIESYFEQSRLADRLQLHIGVALEVIDQIDGQFDLVFIDADKENYPAYYEKVLPRLRIGGLILADNALWSGKVLEEKPQKETQGIKTFNDMVQADTRVQNLIVPIRDGLMIARKL